MGRLICPLLEEDMRHCDIDFIELASSAPRSVAMAPQFSLECGSHASRARRARRPPEHSAHPGGNHEHEAAAAPKHGFGEKGRKHGLRTPGRRLSRRHSCFSRQGFGADHARLGAEGGGEEPEGAEEARGHATLLILKPANHAQRRGWLARKALDYCHRWAGNSPENIARSLGSGSAADRKRTEPIP